MRDILQHLDTSNLRTGFGTGTAPTYTVDVSGTLRSTGASYFATTSGNVGIGTVSPAGNLEVVDATVLGSEFVVNGGFTSDTSSWTPVTSTLASVAGGQSGNALQITSGGYTYQSFSSVVNTRYLVSYYFKKVLRQAEH